jgi:hypothetical protein
MPSREKLSEFAAWCHKNITGTERFVETFPTPAEFRSRCPLICRLEPVAAARNHPLWDRADASGIVRGRLWRATSPARLLRDWPVVAPCWLMKPERKNMSALGLLAPGFCPLR